MFIRLECQVVKHLLLYTAFSKQQIKFMHALKKLKKDNI